MMNDRPCPSGRHSFVASLDRTIMKCENCPLTLSMIDLMLGDKFGKNRLINIIKEKEREWYIKELET